MKLGTSLLSLASLVTLTLGADFSNPILWEDLADADVLRVDDTYYYSASTMHYSPGAPILRSYDLVNWEFIAHSVPSLEFGAAYNLSDGQNAYVKGVWASSLRYRPSNGLWYWIGCIEFTTTYIYTAPDVTGPWSQSGTIDTCYYDCGLLIDDDDTMYVAYGGTTISVATLSEDGLSQVSTTDVWTNDEDIEGSRFYKIDGSYYILNVAPGTTEEFVMKSDSPTGTYTQQTLMPAGVASPVSGQGNPHQGGIVDTPDGQWYYMAFCDAYPGGRIPVLAPISWSDDGWPTLQGGDTWATTYPYPVAEHELSNGDGRTDEFDTETLQPWWEWNHNPDTNAYSTGNGLTLSTVTVTDDLYQAQNTLTHRILGPQSQATMVMDFSSMSSGDRAGLVMLRDSSAWVGVIKSSDSYKVAVWSGITMGDDWSTTSTGSQEDSADLDGTNTQIWLRVAADVASGSSSTATFSYSTDGSSFTTLGSPFTLNNSWEFFMGYRYGIFNFATESLGGSVQVSSFTMEQTS